MKFDCRITWLNELISHSPDAEDDVVNILTVFCNHLVDKKPSEYLSHLLIKRIK